MIYNAKIHGDNSKDCHSKCNNVSNTFSLVTTNKNKKFGLFRSIPIGENGSWQNDNKAFFISYDNKKIYKMKNNAISFDQKYFIETREGIKIEGNIFKDEYNCPDKGSFNQNWEGFNEDYELTGGEKKYRVKYFEVFQFELN